MKNINSSNTQYETLKDQAKELISISKSKIRLYTKPFEIYFKYITHLSI